MVGCTTSLQTDSLCLSGDGLFSASSVYTFIDFTLPPTFVMSNANVRVLVYTILIRGLIQYVYV